MQIEKASIDSLNIAVYNPRKDLKETDPEYIKLKNSVEHFGYVEPVIVNKRNMTVVGGHQRIKVLKDLGYKDIEVVYVDLDETNEKALNIALNKISGDWDAEKLEDLLRDISLDTDFDVELTGFDLDEIETMFSGSNKEIEEADKKNNKTKESLKEAYDSVEHYSLKELYGMPPFSVLNISILNTRDGDWDKNNAFWKEKINDNAEARSNAACMNRGFDKYAYTNFKSDVVSILDPTLCELINRWFLPKEQNNQVFDTFAGDTAMGFVTGALNNYYTGIELRQEQVDWNVEQFKNNGLSQYSKYICDDGRNVLNHIAENSMDLYFSCPPYYDLEVYSDKENDASNQATYEEFYAILDDAFTKSIKCLKDNRFAVIVAGDVRNKKTGGYYDFLGDIKKTFIREGCIFYNEMILVNKIGSAIITTNNCMKNRKIKKIHQNVLVFYKGDTSKIKDIFFDIKQDSIDKLKAKYDIVDEDIDLEGDTDDSKDE